MVGGGAWFVGPDEKLLSTCILPLACWVAHKDVIKQYALALACVSGASPHGAGVSHNVWR